jgi:hypothetical protein
MSLAPRLPRLFDRHDSEQRSKIARLELEISLLYDYLEGMGAAWTEDIERRIRSESDRAELIRQRDALIARELRRQERSRLAGQVLTIQIWGSE